MPNSMVVFLGPTLSVEVARTVCNALYLPPAKQGDILSAVVNFKPNMIGLIDGEFFQSLSVWHKEIMFVMKHGVKVFGASSMGALRAAELCDFGMIGVGEIFSKYYSEELLDDDEVALQYADQNNNYRAFSLPLVNIRATLQRLVENSIISDNVVIDIIKVAKNLYFPDRTANAIFLQQYHDNYTKEYLDAIKLDFINNYIDLKQIDAMQLLQVMANQNLLACVSDDFTDYSALYQHERIVLNEFGSIRLGELSSSLAVNLIDFDHLNFNAINRHLVRLFADYLQVTVNECDVEREKRSFCLQYGLISDEAMRLWLSRNDLSQCEFNQLMKEVAVCKRMHQWLFHSKKVLEKNTKVLLDELRLKNIYEQHKNETICRYEKTKNSLKCHRINSSSLSDIGARFWGKQTNVVWSSPDVWFRESGFHDSNELFYQLSLESLMDDPRPQNNKYYVDWVEKNNKEALNHIIFELNDRWIADQYKNLSISIQKSLFSYVFSKEINFYWKINYLNGIEWCKIDQLVNKFNIYEKRVSNFIYYNSVHGFEPLLNMIHSLIRLNAYYEYFVEVNMPFLEKFLEMQNNKIIPTNVKITIILFVDEDVARQKDRLCQLLSNHSIKVILTPCFMKIMLSEKIETFFNEVFLFWAGKRFSARILTFEEAAKKILHLKNCQPNQTEEMALFINADMQILYLPLLRWWRSLSANERVNDRCLARLWQIDSLTDIQFPDQIQQKSTLLDSNSDLIFENFLQSIMINYFKYN